MQEKVGYVCSCFGFALALHGIPRMPQALAPARALATDLATTMLTNHYLKQFPQNYPTKAAAGYIWI